MDEINTRPVLHGIVPASHGLPPNDIAPARPLAGDILAGANEIAEFLFGDRKHRRKVYNLVETARLPVFRLGANICARRSVLLAWIAEQEGQSGQ